ncbi:MAG TPA: tRNA (adenosine(37)-N6)-threonylcarbamoyltransferase complex dimerization subunit type 1 TsaB [Anaerolineaceae bacterium]|nr:tRNA (adenosine(37)-N6)-threonylcarbamoyltransferase complex dimerization subunit type 1 TsaB [Anaerolineaceae bacterium]
MLLALDTSTQTMGIALYMEGQVVAEMSWRTASHHTVELAPAIDALLKRSAVKPTDLQALAVALGPGSFTSLRIGLAVAKGMALALHLPILGIPTFEFLARSLPPSQNPALLLLPAGRSRYAVQWFGSDGKDWTPAGELTVMTAEQISESIEGPTHILGEMSPEDRKVIGRKWKNAMLVSPALGMRRTSLLAEMAWERWKAGKVDDPISLAPIYLHVAGAIPE